MAVSFSRNSPLPFLLAGGAAFIGVMAWGFLLALLTPSSPAADEAFGGAIAQIAFGVAGAGAIGTQLWRTSPRALGVLLVIGAGGAGLALPLLLALPRM
ncbi:MAG: hypothetical protein VYE22_27835 [Myxococcota bacterium]|nr:hypothetical protein [Myxococcota bacterium]